MSIHVSERITAHLTDMANLVGQLESELSEAHAAAEAEHARAEQDRNSYTRAHNKHVFQDQRDRIAELTTKLNEALSDAERFKGDYLNACSTVAAMHEAATGRHGEAATRGVVEDVEDMKTMLDHAQQRIKNTETAIGVSERLHLAGAQSRALIAEAITRNPSEGH